jgi:D-arabinose 1-dehydrogenase-like Zn-dependent alcohol dehydrogenase
MAKQSHPLGARFAMTRRGALAGVGAITAPPVVRARAQSTAPLKIGVLMDLSAIMADYSGPGAVASVNMADEDFGAMVQVGVFGGELNVSLIGLIFRAVTIMGNNTGNLTDLHEVARLARDGSLAPIPVTTMPRDQANAALMRLRDGRVTGCLVLTADAAA